MPGLLRTRGMLAFRAFFATTVAAHCFRCQRKVDMRQLNRGGNDVLDHRQLRRQHYPRTVCGDNFRGELDLLLIITLPLANVVHLVPARLQPL